MIHLFGSLKGWYTYSKTYSETVLIKPNLPKSGIYPKLLFGLEKEILISFSNGLLIEVLAWFLAETILVLYMEI